jgi:predicted nuclease of predicted toxin-antitoxin system
MKILFDECVPVDLRKFFDQHTIVTVTEKGWMGIKNGKLLTLASEEFDVFITVDKNLSFQQNASALPVPVIVIHSFSNKVKHLAILVPEVKKLLKDALPKQVFHVGA